MTSKLAQEIVDALNTELDTGFSDDAGIPKADEIVDRILREHSVYHQPPTWLCAECRQQWIAGSLDLPKGTDHE